MQKKLYFSFIVASLIFACISHTLPTIVPFNYQTDMPAIEQLLKKEWHSLFYTPRYDANIVALIFKTQRPGDPAARQHALQISVLKDDTTLIGFITYYQTNKETGHIELLAIDSIYKGLGFGKQLLHFAQNWFARLGCRYLQLYVYTTNHPAIQFYNHLGFSVKKTFSNYLLFSKEI